MNSREKMQTQIRSAIERSELSNQMVRIQIYGDSGDALAAVTQVTDCHTGYSQPNSEGEDKLYIWGKDVNNYLIWRLNITLVSLSPAPELIAILEAMASKIEISILEAKP